MNKNQLFKIVYRDTLDTRQYYLEDYIKGKSSFEEFLENIVRIFYYFSPERISHHISLSKLEYKEKVKIRNLSCCYLFLDHNYNVLYVGQTKNFYQRLSIHKNNKTKLFDVENIILIQMETHNLQKEEKLAIGHFNPKYNRRK